jgi:hypothetical protein
VSRIQIGKREVAKACKLSGYSKIRSFNRGDFKKLNDVVEL